MLEHVIGNNMKKLIIILFLFSASVMAGVEFNFDGELGTNIQPDDSLESSNGIEGFVRVYKKVAMNASQDVVVAAEYYTTGRNIFALVSQNNGVDWTLISNIGSGQRNYYYTLWGFGDSTFFLIEGPNTVAGNAVVGIIKGTSLKDLDAGAGTSTCDTISLDVTKSGRLGRLGIWPIGNRIIVAHQVDSGTSSQDTLHAHYSGGELSTTGTWSILHRVSGIAYGLSSKIPLTWSGGTKGGLLSLTNTGTNPDFVWYDTVGGFNMINDVINYCDVNLQTMDFVPYKDSFFLVTWQEALGDTLFAKMMKITGYGTGSASVSKVGDSVVLAGRDVIKNATSFAVNPTITVLNGGDSAWVFYKIAPDTTRLDSIPIVYNRLTLSTSGISSVGTRTVFKPAKNAATAAKIADSLFINLQSPPKTYLGGGIIPLWVFYTDSGGTVDRQKLYAYFDSVVVLSPPSTTTTKKLGKVKLGKVKLYHSEREYPWIIKENHEDIF